MTEENKSESVAESALLEQEISKPPSSGFD